jgi:hypothetical protein
MEDGVSAFFLRHGRSKIVLFSPCKMEDERWTKYIFLVVPWTNIVIFFLDKRGDKYLSTYFPKSM